MFQFPKETSGWARKNEPPNRGHCQSSKAMLPIEREDRGKMTLTKAKAVLCALMSHVSLAVPFEGLKTPGAGCVPGEERTASCP